MPYLINPCVINPCAINLCAIDYQARCTGTDES